MFVAQVGEASITSNPEEVSDPDSLSQKCLKLQDKLNLLLRTLQIESNATPASQSEMDRRRRSNTLEDIEQAVRQGSSYRYKWHSESDLTADNSRSISEPIGPKKPSKQKVFIPKDHLWSRANSLKKALREIIDHTESGKF